MFDLNLSKILVLLVIAVVVFGPDQLPRIAMQAGRALRELRRMAEGAKNDLREGLGPEFADFDFTDLNPRSLVRKHLLDEVDFDQMLASPDASAGAALPTAARASASALPPGEDPPYDAEAT